MEMLSEEGFGPKWMKRLMTSSRLDWTKAPAIWVSNWPADKTLSVTKWKKERTHKRDSWTERRLLLQHTQSIKHSSDFHMLSFIQKHSLNILTQQANRFSHTLECRWAHAIKSNTFQCLYFTADNSHFSKRCSFSAAINN